MKCEKVYIKFCERKNSILCTVCTIFARIVQTAQCLDLVFSDLMGSITMFEDNTVFSDLLGSVTMFGSRILRPDGVCHNVRWSYSQIWQCSEIVFSDLTMFVFLDLMASVTMFGYRVLNRRDGVCHNVQRSYSEIWQCSEIVFSELTMFGDRILRSDNVRRWYSQTWWGLSQCSQIVFSDVMGSVTMFGDRILRSDGVCHNVRRSYS